MRAASINDGAKSESQFAYHTSTTQEISQPSNVTRHIHGSWTAVPMSDSTSVLNDEEQISISPQISNWEHFGPTSWITICSQPGLRWVAERTGTDDLAHSAKGLLLSWSQRLKFNWTKDRTIAPEPDYHTALAYTNAYFEDSFEAYYGAVYRPEFETRLTQHFREATLDDDPSWYALRNIVYATGCRTLLSKQGIISWQEIQHRSWPFFENALSVYVELLFTPTGLMAIRALVAMNLHLEGAGNPALESMMCASAVRLAQSKGLHRQPASNWNLPRNEILHRNWLFWAIYALENQFSHRSGRPSVGFPLSRQELDSYADEQLSQIIDDANISCQIPSSIPPGSTIDLEFLTAMIAHAQISARICKKLLTVSAFRQPPADIIEVMDQLIYQLEHWKDSLPTALSDDLPGTVVQLSNTRRLNKILYLKFAYYGSLTAIHTIFFFPWISAICDIDPHNKTHSEQIANSTRIVADTARSIIRATRSMQVNATSPQWLVFYYPMVGLINLFLHILKQPSLASASSDVAILDIAVGHFGHLEILSSSELSYPFAREVAGLAHMTVKRHKKANADPAILSTPTPESPQAPQFDAGNVDFETCNFGFDALVSDSFSIFGTDDIPVEGDMIYFPP
ncbi:hypothetical protein LTR84_003208 [Exophiala bonariae]|uniref:Xylanolytic transcriptional activator regulatory domain-containing protein n=1 Tax=Exophiala bonariae TaxID=1690606 RepID=A0AAV9N9D1_9EURO|nr:hypothetical protein LTR84_003208 [Exophiala bonariae]